MIITLIKSLSLSIPIFLLIISILFSLCNSITFDVQNNCPFTVWAAATPGGGQRLDRGQTWLLDVPAGSGRVWGRTNCFFDGAGRGQCQTGDCSGDLECQGSGGAPPCTLAEYALSNDNQIYLDISLVDGFNVPIEFGPTSGSDSGNCQVIRCTGDITGQCPDVLRAPRGCNNPCTVFKTDEYCCTSGRENCTSTNFSGFFKSWCRDAYTYPLDSDALGLFFCPLIGTSYRVVFCPN